MNKTVSVFIGLSIDGFIARPDGTLDFLEIPGVEPSDDDHGYHAFMERIDALVMGRATYDTVLGFDVEWPYKRPVFVLTHRPLDDVPDDADVHPVAGTPQEVIDALAAKGHHRLYVDGGKTVQQFLAAGLVDELILTRVPVLIGAGIPLFGPLPHDVRLEHTTTRTLPGGMVQSTYRVLPSSA